MYRDQSMRFAAEDLKVKRLRRIHRTIRHHAAAEETLCEKVQLESDILMLVAERGDTFSSLDPETETEKNPIECTFGSRF